MSAHGEVRISLYEHLDFLDSLDQAESSPELQAHLTEQIKDQIAKGARDKIESIHRLLAQLDATDQAISTEQERLTKRAQHVDRVRQSVRGMVLRGMQAHGIKSIEGQTCRFTVKKSPSHVVIEDEAKVPDMYKQVTVTMGAHLWAHIYPGFYAQIGPDVNIRTAVCKPRVSQAIKAGAVVPGADLSMNDEYLAVE